MSRKRFTSTISFHAGRTTGVAVPPTIACNCACTIGSSFGECSVSSSTQSKPACARISATMWEDSEDHIPICGFPAFRACLKLLRGRSIIFPYLSYIYTQSVRLSVMRIGIRGGRARMEEVEVAALVGLGNMLREHLAVAARIMRRARLPRRFPLRQLLRAHLQLQL